MGGPSAARQVQRRQCRWPETPRSPPTARRGRPCRRPDRPSRPGRPAASRPLPGRRRARVPGCVTAPNGDRRLAARNVGGRRRRGESPCQHRSDITRLALQGLRFDLHSGPQAAAIARTLVRLPPTIRHVAPSKMGSSAFGVSSTSPRMPASSRARTRAGHVSRTPQRARAARASSSLDGSGAVGPLPITDGTSSIRSDKASVTMCAGRN